jgi:hypothetical protein
VKLFGGVTIDHSREAGAHWVDEHQVGLGEQRERVVNQLARRADGVAKGVALHHARANSAQMQPHRRRARPTVEDKHHRALGGVFHTIERVRNRKHLRPRFVPLALAVFVGFFAQRGGAGQYGVGGLLACNADAVARFAALVLRGRVGR